MTVLRGMTWNHARGIDPLVAASAAFAQRHPDVRIEWDARSLQAFGDQPLEQLVAQYDLLVIDHPHIGDVVAQGLLVALDEPEHADALAQLAAHSIGASHPSYAMRGRQWALAIDAAAQVSIRRPDLLERAPTRWQEVIDLAADGRVVWPLKPVDAISSFFTLAANIGHSVARSPERLIEPEAGRQVLRAMKAVSRHLPADCFGWSPIDAAEALAADQQRFAYVPLAYGYTNYSRAGFRPHRLAYGDIAALGADGPVGATLGGTGIAVSARSAHVALACEFCWWVASGEVQAGLYVANGGQPAHAAAWDSARADELCGGFFSGTRRTMDGSWLRPRYAGFLRLADEGGDLVNAFVRAKIDEATALAGLEASYLRSRPAQHAGEAEAGGAA
jgi:multiple sugar transport system substrate-binding protein